MFRFLNHYFLLNTGVELGMNSQKEELFRTNNQEIPYIRYLLMRDFGTNLFDRLTVNILIIIALTNNLCTSPEKNRTSTKTAKNQIAKDETTYQKGLLNDRLGKREVSLTIYSSIKPSSQYSWKVRREVFYQIQ